MTQPAPTIRRQIMTILALSGMIFQIMLGLVLPAAAVTSPASAYLILCSADDATRTVAIDADGQPATNAAGNGHCDVCLIADLGAGGLSENAGANRYSRTAEQVFSGYRSVDLADDATGTRWTRAPPV